MDWSTFHCCDQILDIYNLKKNLFWLTISEGSVHGHLAPKHKHLGERAWQGKAIHFMAARKQKVRKEPRMEEEARDILCSS